MKLFPFPFPFNIGTDIVHLPRIHRILTGRYRDRFMSRILCGKETADFAQRFNFDANSPHDGKPSILHSSIEMTGEVRARSLNINIDMTRWVAGRFAAKEAARKAAPDGAAHAGWKEVWVKLEDDAQGQTPGNDEETRPVRSSSRRPEIVYLMPEYRGQVGKLSISHDGEYIVATVLASTMKLCSSPAN